MDIQSSRFDEEINFHPNREIFLSILEFRTQCSDSPPIGLSVYDMYGRSESEQTLMGGETGRESSGGGLESTS